VSTSGRDRPGARRPGFGQRRRAWADGGSITVEFALTLPIVMSLLYGFVELSHYAYADIALADAARDGARYAMVRGATSASPATGTTITSYVKGRLTLLDPSQVTVTVSYEPNNSAGSVVDVQLSYPFTPFLPGFGYIGAKTLLTSSAMTITE
jgi:Flp pilus assembly protein TadG